jgi:hypothetical protein
MALFSQKPIAGALIACAAAAFCAAACSGARPLMPSHGPTLSPFESDLAFLKEHTKVVLLGTSPGGAQVAVAPEYQGRVMTSTTGGAGAPSFGWIGRAAIASRARQPHINVFGGEDRFWLGPEGGQYSLFFKPGDPFDLDHWQTPEAIDWGAWDVVEQSGSSVRFRKKIAVTNYSGTRMEIDVDRVIRLLGDADIASRLGHVPSPSVRVVAFESSNTVTNTGTSQWQPDGGLVSAWILGMFNPSPETAIIIPFVTGPETELGPIVNDRYFGKVPDDRLRIEGSVLVFKGDGQFRSKIGLSPARARAVAGSYDAASHVLTLVQYTKPSTPARYVNSMWEIQRNPYEGDVVNSYNDGPPAPGKPPLGPFYELETSSPALALAAGDRYTHVHRTYHLTGPEADLDRLSRASLGAPLPVRSLR